MSMVSYVIWAPALESMLFLPFLLPLGLTPETQTTKTVSRKHNPNPVFSTEEKHSSAQTLTGYAVQSGPSVNCTPYVSPKNEQKK